jgi:nucleoside-diphosphate-sugar epimerase
MGKGQTIGEMAKVVLSILGKQNLPIKQDKRRVRPEKSEIMRLISENTKAREICGWIPNYNFEEGLAETIAWIKKNLHRYRPDDYTV